MVFVIISDIIIKSSISNYVFVLNDAILNPTSHTWRQFDAFGIRIWIGCKRVRLIPVCCHYCSYLTLILSRLLSTTTMYLLAVTSVAMLPLFSTECYLLLYNAYTLAVTSAATLPLFLCRMLSTTTIYGLYLLVVTTVAALPLFYADCYLLLLCTAYPTLGSWSVRSSPPRMRMSGPSAIRMPRPRSILSGGSRLDTVLITRQCVRFKLRDLGKFHKL